MDYWQNKKIVDKQYRIIMSNAKSGETVVRDELHRFISAQS